MAEVRLEQSSVSSIEIGVGSNFFTFSQFATIDAGGIIRISASLDESDICGHE
jgi:hypothetical protein